MLIFNTNVVVHVVNNTGKNRSRNVVKRRTIIYRFFIGQVTGLGKIQDKSDKVRNVGNLFLGQLNREHRERLIINFKL